MNATQHKSPGRLADPSPFGIKVTLEPPKPSPPARKAVDREIPRGAARTDADYGCVDWYQYRGSRADGPRATD
jgi:hypothetical protein